MRDDFHRSIKAANLLTFNTLAQRPDFCDISIKTSRCLQRRNSKGVK